MNPVNSVRGASIQDRMRQQQSGANAPTPCSNCGGFHSFEVNASQYNMSNYAARPLGTSPQRLIICLCGHMSAVGINGANGPERSAFLESLEHAKEHRQKNDPSKLIKNSASISELEQVKAELEELTQRFETLIAFIEQQHPEEDSSEEVEDKTEEPTPVPAKKVKR